MDWAFLFGKIYTLHTCQIGVFAREDSVESNKQSNNYE
jgi:hypothetical protein